MALAVLGPLVGKLSGSLGGVIFREGKGTPQVTHRPRRRTATSARALTARSYVIAAQQRWITLTTAQRTDWNNFALGIFRPNRFGVWSPMRGQALYVSCNAHNLLAGTPWEDDMPTSSQKWQSIQTAPNMSDLPQYIVCCAGPSTPPYTHVHIFGQRSFSTSHWRTNSPVFIATHVAMGPVFNFFFTDEFIAALGEPPAGERVMIWTKSKLTNGIPCFRQPYYLTVEEA